MRSHIGCVSAMSDPIKIRNLYYLRKRVPTDIVGTFEKTKNGRPKAHICIPLNTDKWADAKRAMPDAEKQAQALFDDHRRKIGIGTALVVAAPVTRTPQQACEEFYEQLREQERKHRQEIVKQAKADPHSFFAAQSFWSSDPMPVLHPAPAALSCLDELHGVLAQALAREITRRLNNARGALAVMDLDDIRKATGETDEALLPLLARTEIAFLEALETDPGALFNPMPMFGSVSLGAAIPLNAVAMNGGKNPNAKDAANEWFKMRLGSSGNDWSMERQSTWREALAVFLEVCGDKTVSAYTVDNKGELQDVFRKLPAGRNKKVETRGRPIQEQITVAAQRALPLMHPKTANEYLRMIDALFDWCKGRYSVMQNRNPFEGSALRVSKAGNKPRDGFTTDELKALFANPFYAKHADTDWKYWTPLVQLYTGARSNSILRLKVRDIRTEEGVTFFDINDEEYQDPRIKRTDKTAAGLRRVPVHPDLVTLGLLKFQAKCKGERLFNDLKVSKRGKFVKPYGDWFRRHLEALGIKRRGLDTHSFRHTWDKAAEDSRIHEEWRSRLQGHAKQGMRKVYGGRTELQLLDEEMQKLRFKGLSLTHLKR